MSSTNKPSIYLLPVVAELGSSGATNLSRPGNELTPRSETVSIPRSGGVFQRLRYWAEPLKAELDAFVVVVVDVTMHARFKCINASGRRKMEILGFQGAEETFNHNACPASH
jgi:hypothetical protein